MMTPRQERRNRNLGPSLEPRFQGPVSTSPLNQLDGVAVRIGDPSGTQLAVEKVMGRREQGRPLGDQGAQCGISVIGPNDDFDPAPFSFRTKAVVLPCRLYCSNSETEPSNFSWTWHMRVPASRAVRPTHRTLASPSVVLRGARPQARRFWDSVCQGRLAWPCGSGWGMVTRAGYGRSVGCGQGG
jgi:hypothetical protein